MSDFYFEVKEEKYKIPGIKRWCLDFPKDNQVFFPNDASTQVLVVQGWVLRESIHDLTIEVIQDGITTAFQLNTKRSDVIDIVLKHPPENHPQLVCGFNFNIHVSASTLAVGFRWEGNFHEIALISVKNKMNIIVGKKEWLFLDNDTNQSVEQHQGLLLIPDDEKQSWITYFHDMQHQFKNLNVQYAILVAPTKEAIYPEFHPYKQADYTTIDQLKNICPKGFPLVYPKEKLSSANIYTYYKTDTHWTSYGACLATIELAKALGFEESTILDIFINDRYKVIKKSGDLGIKFYPSRSAEELAQATFSCHALIKYDNRMANFGRIMHIDNKNAKFDLHCLQFGSSSSYAMLNFMSRLFSRLTIIHTAGNIDMSIVQDLKPDIVVSQTNARFVIRAPTANYSVEDVLYEKVALMPKDTINLLLSDCQKYFQGNTPEIILKLHNYLLNAVSKL